MILGNAHASPEKLISYYPYIIELHNSPIKYHADQSNPYDLGTMYRAVITYEEAYYYLLVEKFQVGDEGSLTYISSNHVPLDIHSKIEFIKWLNDSAFEILVKNHKKIIYVNTDGKTSMDSKANKAVK